MSLCASCRTQLSGDAALCPHHDAVYGDGWAASNRILCDFLHRGLEPARVSQAEREDFWTETPAPDAGWPG